MAARPLSPYTKGYGPVHGALVAGQPGTRKRASSKRGAQFQPLSAAGPSANSGQQNQVGGVRAAAFYNANP